MEQGGREGVEDEDEGGQVEQVEERWWRREGECRSRQERDDRRESARV